MSRPDVTVTEGGMLVDEHGAVLHERVPKVTCDGCVLWVPAPEWVSTNDPELREHIAAQLAMLDD